MTTLNIPPIPSSVHPDSWSAPFWEAIQRGELRIPRCAECGTFRLPPGPFCWVCQSQEVDWFKSAGRGTVYSFTIARHALTDHYADCVPYAIALIELDDAPGTRLIANLVDVADTDVAIGIAVRAVWPDNRAGAAVMPLFTPTRDGV